MALVRWLPTCATEVPDASTARVVRLRRFRSGSCEFRSPRLRESGDIHVSHSPASDIVVGIDGRPRNVRRPVASRESAAAVHSCWRSEASPQKCARRLGYTDGPVSDCKAARLRAPDVRLPAPDFRLQASGSWGEMGGCVADTTLGSACYTRCPAAGLRPAPGRSGGTGRRAGLKIRFASRRVWVRFPPPAPRSQ